MIQSPLKALVVDDDAAVRQLTARALRGEGFSCDVANDGLEAQIKVGADRYDLVVTDLCMPNRHGHALASQLITGKDRPLVVVLTAISDPRMTKDLLTRGVDDVILKPVDYLAFAAKLRALVNRRAADPQRVAAVAAAADGSGAAVDCLKAPSLPPLSQREFETHLARVGQILPLSPHVLTASQLAQSKKCSSQELAAAVESEAALAVEVLRLANSSYYNPAGSRIANLVEAIPRVGHRRVGELALSLHALQLLQIGDLPWMDRELAWRRSIAAGLAADLLVEQGDHAAIQNGLFLSATMHSLGRVTLGVLFPQHYESFVRTCAEQKQSLLEHENRVFPMTHAACMARLLQSWSVPSEVFQPLRYLLEDFSATARFAEPMRSKVELVKLAVLLGWIAVGPWESWDTVEFASPAVFKRLRVADPSDVLQQVRSAMSSLAIGSDAPAFPKAGGPNQAKNPKTREIRYHTLSTDAFDVLAALFEGMNLTIRTGPDSNEAMETTVVVNCLAASPAQVAAYGASAGNGKLILLCCGNPSAKLDAKDRVVRLPASYAALRAACEEAAIEHTVP